MQPNQELVRGSLRGLREERHGRHRRIFADDVVWNASGTRKGRVPRRKLELFAAIGTLGELTGGALRGGIHCVLANDHHVVVLQRTRGERAGRAQLEDPEVIVFYVRPQSRSSRAGRRP